MIRALRNFNANELMPGVIPMVQEGTNIKCKDELEMKIGNSRDEDLLIIKLNIAKDKRKVQI